MSSLFFSVSINFNNFEKFDILIISSFYVCIVNMVGKFYLHISIKNCLVIVCVFINVFFSASFYYRLSLPHCFHFFSLVMGKGSCQTVENRFVYYFQLWDAPLLRVCVSVFLRVMTLNMWHVTNLTTTHRFEQDSPIQPAATHLYVWACQLFFIATFPLTFLSYGWSCMGEWFCFVCIVLYSE